MSSPDPVTFFKQSLKSDAYFADELINIYLLRPIASMIVWLVYPTSVTPNLVTTVAIVIGVTAAFVYSVDTPMATAVAGTLVLLKDVFDDADGQLARAKALYSRRGRFFDSVADFVVNVLIFAAITDVVYKMHPMASTLVLGFLSFLGITLRVSYHVYYQVSFLHLEGGYTFNRIVEEITDDDRSGDPVALYLQQQFTLIYSWQDKLMYFIDQWCKG